MAFTRKVYGNTITASELNDDFYHVAEGDLLPRGDTDLSGTDLRYDIGDSAYKWNSIHASTINVSSKIVNGWEFVAAVTVPAAFVQRINFDGLDGDKDDMYMITALMNLQPYQTTSITAYMYINNDSTTADKSNKGQVIRKDVWMGHTGSTSDTRFRIMDITSSAPDYEHFFSIYINAKSGRFRQFTVNSMTSPELGGSMRGGGVWFNSNDNITSLTFIHQVNQAINSGTVISLFRRAYV